MKPGRHHIDKQRCQDLCQEVHDCAQSLVLGSYTLQELRNPKISIGQFLVSSKKVLWFLHGQGQKREQKYTTKNCVEFHNHSPLLTMVTRKLKNIVYCLRKFIAEQREMMSVRLELHFWLLHHVPNKNHGTEQKLIFIHCKLYSFTACRATHCVIFRNYYYNMPLNIEVNLMATRF